MEELLRGPDLASVCLCSLIDFQLELARQAFEAARQQAPSGADLASVTISGGFDDRTEAQVETIAKRLKNLVRGDLGKRCMEDICGDQTDDQAPISVDFFVVYETTYLDDN